MTLVKPEKVIFTPDWHVPFHDKEALDKFFALIKDYKPNEIVLGGNLNDCSMFSRHPKKREVAKLFKTAREERTHWFEIAKKLRKSAPDAKIVYIGSDCHEGWLEMWASSSDILVDDPTYEIANFYHLSDYDIEFADREYIKNDFLFTHGTCCRKGSGASAIQELEYNGTSGASGHTHSLGSAYRTVREVTEVWFECGCFCQRSAWYKLRGKTKHMNWQQGFLSMNFIDNLFSGQLIPVVRDSKDKPKIFFNGDVY